MNWKNLKFWVRDYLTQKMYWAHNSLKCLYQHPCWITCILVGDQNLIKSMTQETSVLGYHDNLFRGGSLLWEVEWVHFPCPISIVAIKCNYGNCTYVPHIPHIKIILMSGNMLMLNSVPFLRMVFLSRNGITHIYYFIIYFQQYV